MNAPFRPLRPIPSPDPAFPTTIGEGRPPGYGCSPSPLGGGSPTVPGVHLSSAAWIQRREQFYALRIGPPREPAVYHWEDGDDPHVDVYVYHRRREEVVVTGGLADRRMPGNGPGGPGEPGRVELILRMRRMEEWVPAILREIATLPFRFGVPLRPGGVIEGNHEVRSGSLLRHALLDRATGREGLGGFVVEGELVEFLGVSFLTPKEFAFALERGPTAIARRLSAGGALGVLDPDRGGVL